MEQQDIHNNSILQNIFLLENIQGGIVYSDSAPPFRLRYATEGMAQLSGYSREELLTMEQMELVHADDIEALINDVGRQLSKGDTFEVEYRLKRKDGSYAYVLDRAKVVLHDDGNTYIHCLLTDITALKRMEQDLRLSKEKYKIAMRQSGNTILEYTPGGVLELSENYDILFGSKAPRGTLEELVASGWVAEAHAKSMIALFEASIRQKKNAYMELQIQVESGRYVWCSLHLTPLFPSGGLVYAIVGCLQNIDARRRHLENLTKLSQKDGLTNTYNRATVEAYINQHLQSPTGAESGALIILDVDYFKNINDTMGHAAGDDLLIRLVGTIRQILQPGYLLGRLGGDEFLIFTTQKISAAEIGAVAQHIVEHVGNAFSTSPYPITVSLGVAICGPKCNSFKALYKNADVALYETKNRGRNGLSIFVGRDESAG